VSQLRIKGDDRKVVLHPLPGEEVWVQVDTGKMMLALTNVLSNAYKYSPAGGEISVETTRRIADGRPQVGIAVRDRGIGMSPEQVARVFERFFRADPSGAIPGTGLGMSLVKEVVEFHGGEVAVQSSPGQGTTVSIWLPEVA
jgi:signal transduction histidine kinase